ncbi:MAG TPA: hypothetical protein PK323_01545 [Bacteroidia bacterium]|nr:hypothetical protein [Bacteroidia bacterium]
MISKITKNKITFLGVLFGAIGGYLYYTHVGCLSGTCAITASPIMSTIYGAVMGGLIFNMFEKEPKNKNDEKN